MSDFRETLYTVDAHGHRKWVYPTEFVGFFKRNRTKVAWVLLSIYLSLPWIPIADNQAVLLDIPGRRFVLFGATFWATDTRFLAVFLASLAITLFFFTSLLGRIWCGWACPQTVFLEFVFRPLERLIEGTAPRRKALDQEPWSFRKVRIKATKLIAFSAVAWLMASTFLAYFVGRERLLGMMSGYPWENWPTFLATVAAMVAILFEFGWFREQFCTVLCPYARFQSVLLDDTSLVISYDPGRGEPRGKLERGDAQRTKGDCIDCGLCVRVCPTGIDIRNGLQLECVQCAVCADACDSVMEKIARPKGLIRYATERGLRGEKVKLLRPRVIVYGTILISLLGTLGWLLSSRELSNAAIFHSHGDSLFEVRADGLISNHLELHLENKSKTSRLFSAVALDESQVQLMMPVSPFPLGPQSSSRVPLFATFSRELLVGGKRHISVKVSDDAGYSETLRVDLQGPG
ncbi:MAG: cytochrome c oxidase accessory protein CcoG [Bdellovibrionota bacterium]